MNENQSSQVKFLGSIYKSLEGIKKLMSDIAVESMDVDKEVGSKLSVIELSIEGLQSRVHGEKRALMMEVKENVK